MNKNVLVVLAVASIFFVAGCACCKSKKTCPMADMKVEEMAAKPAEVAAPAAEAVENAAAPVVEAVQQNAEAVVNAVVEAPAAK